MCMMFLFLLLVLWLMFVFVEGFVMVVGECYGQVLCFGVGVCDVEQCEYVCYIVWYLVQVGSYECVFQIGFLQVLLFEVGCVVDDVVLVVGMWLVLLLLYGNGGSVWMMGWFGIVMVCVGFLVIVVDYFGNNGVDVMIVVGSMLIWECVGDFKVVLVVVYVDLVLLVYLDMVCLGVVGYFVGGFIVLFVVGVCMDL